MTETRERPRAAERRSKGDESLDQGELLAELRAVKNGDFTVRLPLRLTGVSGEIAIAFNEMVALNQQLARELDRTSRVVGRDGRIGQRADQGGMTGSWADCVSSVNLLIGDLTQPTVEVSRVLGAVARGEL